MLLTRTTETLAAEPKIEAKSPPVIEADRYGARLMLPWNVQAGETIIVSIADQVGQYHTQKARVAWTEKLRLGGKVICGVEFAEELQLAC
ncbi:MAG TPA: hypothetical protein EYO33_06050 [Phycisphaerales bacterium]|nr:hypothetical protein [Phycisphaerales bacterium]